MATHLLCLDLLWLDGENLRSLPLIDRKHGLHELIQKSDCPRIIYAQHIEGQDVGFFKEICQRDLEGIVCKRKGGRPAKSEESEVFSGRRQG